MFIAYVRVSAWLGPAPKFSVAASTVLDFAIILRLILIRRRLGSTVLQ